LTVPDDVLPGLVAGLCSAGAELAGRLLAHTSGRHGLAVWSRPPAAAPFRWHLHPVMNLHQGAPTTSTGWPASLSG